MDFQNSRFIVLSCYIDRLGEFSSSGLGILSKPFEYSLWVGAWILLWSPIYFAYQRVKHEKPIADQVKNIRMKLLKLETIVWRN